MTKNNLFLHCHKDIEDRSNTVIRVSPRFKKVCFSIKKNQAERWSIDSYRKSQLESSQIFRFSPESLLEKLQVWIAEKQLETSKFFDRDDFFC